MSDFICITFWINSDAFQCHKKATNVTILIQKNNSKTEIENNIQLEQSSGLKGSKCPIYLQNRNILNKKIKFIFLLFFFFSGKEAINFHIAFEDDLRVLLSNRSFCSMHGSKT